MSSLLRRHPSAALVGAKMPGQPRVGLALMLPGVFLCGCIGLAAIVLAGAETRFWGRAWLEKLVLAILLGTALRTAWTPGRRWMPGVGFSAKIVLEMAVVLLGASVSVRAVAAAGPGLLAGIGLVVAAAIGASYALGRVLGLTHRMAMLVACGNSICGNSAIAAVAPVIGADGEEVAASIAFTAVIGVIVVLALPLTVKLLHLSVLEYGAFAGLTVYAVPQVLAATAPIGAAAVQFGTLVKLMRVLMLGPVVLVLSLFGRSEGRGPAAPAAGHVALVPWFIIGFLACAAARAGGVLPMAWQAPIGMVASALTLVSMAALGLSTDLGALRRAGIRVIGAVTLSLVVLGVLSLGLIHVLRIAS